MSHAVQEALIESVRKRPILYDFTNKDYKDDVKKNQYWELVGEEVNLTGM